MDFNSMNPQQLQLLLNMASSRLGMNPNDLKQSVQSGNFNNMGLSQDQQNQINQILNNPSALAALLQNPQLLSIMAKLNGGK